jgi:hypothetical protein
MFDAACCAVFTPNLAWIIFRGAAIGSMIQGGFFLAIWHLFGRTNAFLGARF